MKKKSLVTNHQSLEPKKALIYDPYLDTAGGGERYCLTVAECLLNNKWQVDIFWDSQKDINRIKDRLNLKINQAGLIGTKPNDLNLLKRLNLLKEYNLTFWLSNGSIPLLVSKRNIIHFQRPFINVKGKSLFNKLRLSRIDNVVCNSKFTKKYIDQEFGISSKVLYPPVGVSEFKPADKKKNIILAVGRFDESEQSKRQDVLIKGFKRLIDQGLKNWKFVLIGGSLADPDMNKYLKKLKKMGKGYPIEFYVNAEFKKLKQYYTKSKLFWHAKGYGVEEDKNPWDTEHFGITPVEAMAAGCVPLVVDKGGLPEIVRRGVGLKWRAVDQLVKKSLSLINDQQKLKQFSKKAVEQSAKFSKKIFCDKLNLIINQK